jgi:hypothetical protein
VRTKFVERVVTQVTKADPAAKTARWLAICAGESERGLFTKLGLTDLTISNLELNNFDPVPFSWAAQNAHQLGYPAGAFDYVFVADGLHHCSSPHRALLEMYRVSRTAAIVVESRDSVLMRVAEALGLTAGYEVDAVVGNNFTSGGVDNTSVPNFVYRWTEREFRKTINCFDPTVRHRFRFFYALNLPDRGGAGTRATLSALRPLVAFVTWIFPRQCNSFAMVVYKPGPGTELLPWLRRDGERIVFDRDYVP